MQIVFLIIMWLTVGAATSYLANQRGRDPFFWFWIGALFGILGLLAIVFLPDLEKKKPIPQEKVEPEQDEREWYYLTSDRKQVGPIDFGTLKSLISQDTYVWAEGMESWQKADELPRIAKDC